MPHQRRCRSRRPCHINLPFFFALVSILLLFLCHSCSSAIYCCSCGTYFNFEPWCQHALRRRAAPRLGRRQWRLLIQSCCCGVQIFVWTPQQHRYTRGVCGGGSSSCVAVEFSTATQSFTLRRTINTRHNVGSRCLGGCGGTTTQAILAYC